MSPTIPTNYSYTSITQSNHRSDLIYSLLFTTFLFFTLGLISQIPPTFPLPLTQHENDVVAAKNPPLIPPEPPKEIVSEPDQTPLPDLVPVQENTPIRPIPNITINTNLTETTDFGTFVPSSYSPSIFDPSYLDTQPTHIITAIPVHPYEMKKEGIGGNVLIEFLIDPSGRVVDPRIVSSSDPAFNQPTLKAIRKWTFTPALKDGIAVWTRARIPLEFSVNK